ncbi:MAG: hypothetical protein NTX50_03355 [Candidatus Sumerlaeota bacterium]|nr:hypothetical protein [Candidatus Sumerlaeota bacterium]
MEATETMTASSLQAAKRQGLREWTPMALAGVLCLSHFIFLMGFFEPAISTPDANGYLGQAALIANTGRSWFALESPLEYVGTHWLKTPVGGSASGSAAAKAPASASTSTMAPASGSPSAIAPASALASAIAPASAFISTSGSVADSSSAGAEAKMGDEKKYRYYSRYPPGLPILQAAAMKLGGPAAALITDPLMSSLTLLGLFLLCRLWVGPWWALLAMAVMALNPGANAHALSHFAHCASAFFCVWGVLFTALWERTRSPLWAFAAGLTLGIIPSVRYPEILMAAACGLFVLLSLRNDKKTWRSLIAGVAGLAIPMGALFIRNQLAFGAFWRTGYALTNEQTGFGWNYLRSHFASYFDTLQSSGMGPFFVLGLAGAAGLCARRETWRRGVLLSLLIVPSTILYMAYYWDGARGDSTMNLRFLVPTYYFYALGGVWLLAAAGQAYPRAAGVAAIATLALVATWGASPSFQALKRLHDGAAPLAKVTAALERNVPAGSVVIAGNQLLQHLHFIGKWRLINESTMQSPARSGRGGRMGGRFGSSGGAGENRPSPGQAGKEEERIEAYKGLTDDQLIDKVNSDVWEYAGKDGRVYYIGTADSIVQFQGRLWPNERMARIETVVLATTASATASDRNRMAMGDGGGGGFGGPGGPGGPGAPDGSPAPPDMAGGPGNFPGFSGDAGGSGGFSRFGGRGRTRGGGMMGMGFSAGSEPLIIAEWIR